MPFAFNSSLKEIRLPASLREIDYGVFYCCKNLEAIGVSSSQNYFETFLGALLVGRDEQKSLLWATICDLSRVGDNNGHITMVGWLDTTVKMGCFSFSNVVRLDWNYITSIESNCFEWCDNLEYVDLDRTVTIGNNVLNYCKSLRSISLPLVSSIGSNILCQNESLESIELACEDLKEINTLGNDCAALREIRIPSGVTSISSSFNNDPSIEVLYVSALTPPSLSDSFNSIPQDAVIYVPCESLGAYKSASGWSSFSDLMVPYDFEKSEICSGQYHYIDEYGIDHGHGVMIGETVWAPVNCGYHATDYKYGKLYQWGRKYGQGYSGGLYGGDYNYIGEYSDASVPEMVAGPVSLSVGQSEANDSKFYYNSTSPYDWLTPEDDNLWNSGTEDNPVKTECDPCPEGWRVPPYSELSELKSNHSSWTTDENDQTGYWFSGANMYTESAPKVFFPAAGERDGGYGGFAGEAKRRGRRGYYWSSRPSDKFAYYLCLDDSAIFTYDTFGRSNGYSVRCVQVTDEVAEL